MTDSAEYQAIPLPETLSEASLSDYHFKSQIGEYRTRISQLQRITTTLNQRLVRSRQMSSIAWIIVVVQLTYRLIHWIGSL